MATPKILSDLLDAVLQSPNGIGFIEKQGSESSLSYLELKQQALMTLGALQKKGVRQGDSLVLFINNNPAFIDVFWACVLGGIVPVPVAVGISLEHRAKLRRILDKLDSAWLLIDQHDLTRLREGQTTLIDDARVVDVAVHSEQHEPGKPAENLDADTVAFIQFSSGSTSDPKGVVLTHKNLLTNIDGLIHAARLVKQDISLSWMPLTHDMGLIGFHLTMLAMGLQHYLMPTELFSRRPLLWMEIASQKQATLLCSPNFGYKHYLRALGDKPASGLSLSSIRCIFNGAEPISVNLIRQFMSRLEPYGLHPNSMLTVYGLAEASLAVAFPEPGLPVVEVSVNRHTLAIGEAVSALDPADNDAISFVAEGQAVRGCRLRIMDNQENTLSDGIIGRIQISGDNVTSGYYKDEQSDASSFTADGWLDTGDIGFISDHGLVVTGRDKDIIFAHGQNYYPHDLENILIEDGVGELGKVVTAGYRQAEADEDELLVFVLYRKDTEGFVETVKLCRRLINEKTGLEVTHVLPVRRIPKTTSGKVQRRFLVEDYASQNHAEFLQELKVLEHGGASDQSDLSPTQTLLKQFVDEVIPDKQLALDANFFDAGISSLALAEIHQKIDDQWPGLVDIVDLFDHQTIAEVASFLELKLA